MPPVLSASVSGAFPPEPDLDSRLDPNPEPFTMAQPQDRPSDRLGAPQAALWAGFTLLLAVGVVLYFRFSDRFAPLLDVVTDR